MTCWLDSQTLPAPGCNRYAYTLSRVNDVDQLRSGPPSVKCGAVCIMQIDHAAICPDLHWQRAQLHVDDANLWAGLLWRHVGPHAPDPHNIDATVWVQVWLCSFCSCLLGAKPMLHEQVPTL